jgi:hypothetical protein
MPSQRQKLVHKIAFLEGEPRDAVDDAEADAIRAALAEVDRLRSEVAALRYAREAAAPLLLEAAREALAAHERSECPTDPCTCRVYDSVRAAIAAAEGEP